MHHCSRTMEARINERVKTGVQDLCAHSLAHYPSFSLQALIAVSLKDGSTVLVTIKETISPVYTPAFHSDQTAEQSQVEQKLSTLLPDLCRDELSDNVGFSVDALIAITIDRQHIIVVSVQESVGGQLRRAKSDDYENDDRKSESLTKTIQVSTEGPIVSKVCHVCGDMSLSRAYGANSCEACRVFFKRILRSGVDYTPCDTPCKITFDSRRCKGCRLKKCRDAGMKSDEWVPSVTVKQEKEKCIPPKPSPKSNSSRLAQREIKVEPLPVIEYLDETEIKSGLYDDVMADTAIQGSDDVSRDDVTRETPHEKGDATHVRDNVTHEDNDMHDDISDDDVTHNDDVTCDVSSDTDEYDVEEIIPKNKAKNGDVSPEQTKPTTRSRRKVRKTTKTAKYKKYHPRPISCNECDFTCASLYNLKLHTETKHNEKPLPNNPLKPISCTECDYECKSNTALSAHIIKMHGGETKPKTKDHQCEICEFKTFTGYRLKRHMKQVHDEAKKKAKQDLKKEIVKKRKAQKPTAKKVCDYCGYTSLYSTNFMRHLIAKHPETVDEERIMKYRCPDCPDRKLSDASQLRTHIRNYHNTSLICPCHGRKFVTAFGMKQHIESMTGTGRFVCEICGKRLVDRRLYRDHMNKHTGVKPYMCDYCGKNFGWRGGLRAHVQACQIKHNESLTEGPHIRPFACPMEGCGKTFINNGRLQHHINGVHIKNCYTCKQCGTTFNYRHKRDVHQKKCISNESDTVPKEEEENVSTSRENDAIIASQTCDMSMTSRDNDDGSMTSRNDVMGTSVPRENTVRTSTEHSLIVPSRFGDRSEFPQNTTGQINYPAAVPNLHYQYVDPDQGFSWALFPH